MGRSIPNILSIVFSMLTVAALSVLVTSVVKAHSASNLTTLTIAEDSFRNYDFVAKVDDPDGVDWPVVMVFGNNASQGKVEFGYENQGVPACNIPTCAVAYVSVNDGGWGWFGNTGIKDSAGCSGTSRHMRYYGDPDNLRRFTNDAWGHFVLATTHFDEVTSCDEYLSGDNKQAQEWFTVKAESQWSPGNVQRNFNFFHNFEQRRTILHPGVDHRPDHHGWANWVHID